MKIPFHALICLAFIVPSVRSQDEYTAVTSSGTMVSELVPGPARILGDIPDGTPPPPEPPKVPFVVSRQDVLESTTHQQGGRTITVQRIKPIALPQPAIPVPPPDPTKPAIQERMAEIQAEYPESDLLFIGATVFHAKDTTVHSLVTLSPTGSGQSVTFWSSADFALLSGFASFIGSDGQTRCLIMSWGNEQIDGTTDDFIASHGIEYGVSKIPALPPGKATFAILSENPSAATLAAVQSLHDLYNNEHDRLQTAYQGRERARLQHEADLTANPPRPKNITLNYWRTEKPAPAKGGAK